MLVTTHVVIRIILWVLQCQTEASSLLEIYPLIVKKTGCALAIETLELVQIKINALDIVFFGMFPKVIFLACLD
jgi:hypothetical protein